MRTFIALNLSVGAIRRVVEVVEKRVAELGDAGRRLAWVSPAQYHLTLRFLGDIPPESIDAIATTLRRRVSELSPITLRLGGLGCFPAEAAPRVLWVGVDGGKALLSLQSSIESDLQALGFPKEERPYHPHLTIARVPHDENGVSLPAESWRAGATPDLGEDVCTEVVVYESKLEKKSNRGGVEYLARARVPFTNPFSKTR
jgi:2'-5' RNA ligase